MSEPVLRATELHKRFREGSGADALDMMSETTTTPISLSEMHNESRTPSLPDDGEFPCSQVRRHFCCRKKLRLDPKSID